MIRWNASMAVFGFRALLLLLGSIALAEEATVKPERETPAVAAPHVHKRMKNQAVRSRKARPPREKETEGTEAPDRFQADTVIKSEYEVDGKKLEVDPD